MVNISPTHNDKLSISQVLPRHAIAITPSCRYAVWQYTIFSLPSHSNNDHNILLAYPRNSSIIYFYRIYKRQRDTHTDKCYLELPEAERASKTIDDRCNWCKSKWKNECTEAFFSVMFVEWEKWKRSRRVTWSGDEQNCAEWTFLDATELYRGIGRVCRNLFSDFIVLNDTVMFQKHLIKCWKYRTFSWVIPKCYNNYTILTVRNVNNDISILSLTVDYIIWIILTDIEIPSHVIQ